MIDWEAFYNTFRQPDFVPGYEIGHRLGGGAFGDVYMAKKRSIGKPYAVKFLKLEAGQREAVERELEQVRLFAAIDHPNLVTIEDMGVAMGVPYLIMGYAGEDTLARRLKRGELTRESSLMYFVQACRGVLALHDRRLAHFDLKPSNIFIKGEVARVGDYGLAKLLSDGRATLSFGRGTPQYMAPEMLRNKADQRADIYSLGVILFESVCGKLPFPSENNLGLPVRESDDPPCFPGGFPAPLRPVVERSLRLAPADRYASVHELLDELGQSARQGDSVVIPWTGSGVPTPVPAADSPSTPPRQGVSPSASGAASAAADAGAEPGPRDETEARVLSAMAAARGLWQEVVKSGGTGDGVGTPPGTPGGDSASASAPGARGDIVSFKTLDEPDEEGRVRPTRGGPAGLGARSAAALRPVGESTFDPLSSWAAAASRGPLSGAAVSLPAATTAAAATIPVPPRAEGGIPGTTMAVLVLGLEVLLTLIFGPLAWAGRALARAITQIMRGAPGAFGKLMRLVLLMCLMALLGAALVATLVFAVRMQ